VRGGAGGINRNAKKMSWLCNRWGLNAAMPLVIPRALSEAEWLHRPSVNANEV